MFCISFAYAVLKRRNSRGGPDLRKSLRTKAVAICDEKIAKKGEAVGLSFYAFFANRNDDPELLFEAAEWWIKTHALDHFEKALKVRELIKSGQ
ncbi:MAG: hypothetical protein ACI82I_000543 [Gammaproteobacteria bacterium]|jgi:hypothetical protein